MVKRPELDSTHSLREMSSYVCVDGQERDQIDHSQKGIFSALGERHSDPVQKRMLSAMGLNYHITWLRCW
jgi:hypothetical protein